MAKKKQFNALTAGLKNGWRSGLESTIGKLLTDAGVAYGFETVRIPWMPEQKLRHYTPDFVLLDNGIILETKGRFLQEDRKKHKRIKALYPDLDLRFVFSNPKQKISKRSKTTYADWCKAEGFLYAHGSIPKEWLLEPFNKESWTLIRQWLKK